MKKLSAMVMAGVMALGMVGCGSTAAEAPAESTVPAAESTAAETTESTAEAQTETADAQTEAGRQFVVGFDAEFPPYGYKDDSGEYVGFDLDLAQEVCDRLGWTLVKQPIDWDAKDMELDSGAIDCIWNGFTMNGREDQYTFSVPYVDNSQVFVVAEDSGITSKEDLAGKVVGVQKDSSALAALQGDEKALADTFTIPASWIWRQVRLMRWHWISVLQIIRSLPEAAAMWFWTSTFPPSSTVSALRKATTN